MLTRYHAHENVEAALGEYEIRGADLRSILSRAQTWRVFFAADSIRASDVMPAAVGMGVADQFVQNGESVVLVLFYDREMLLQWLLPDAVHTYGSATLIAGQDLQLTSYSSPFVSGRGDRDTTALQSAYSGGLHVHAAVSEDYARVAFDDYIHRILWVMLAVFLLAPLLFWLAIFVESRPLRRLVSQWSIEEADGRVDIYARVRDMLFQYQQTSTKLGRYHALMRTSGIERLLTSKALSDAKVAQLENQIGDFPERFMVGYGEVDVDGNGARAIVMMINQLEGMMESGTIIHRLDGHQFLLILPCGNEAQARSQLASAIHILNSRMTPTMSVSLSAPCDNLVQVAAAYEQARLNHLMRDRTRESGMTACRADAQPTVMQALLTLYQELVEGHEAQALAQVHQLFLRETWGGVGLARRYHTLSTVLVLAARASEGQILPDLPLYDPTQTPKELLKHLKAGAQALCTRSHDQQTNCDDNRRTALLTYVNAHYTDPDLYAAKLGELFEFSEKYIYVVFKEQTGQSPANYIQQLRLKHAARLLVETDLPVQQIAEDVGIANVSTYNKAFKRYYGMNSSQYRESAPDSGVPV